MSESWNRQQLSDEITIYFNGDKIVKVLRYKLGYFEYDTDINTKDRKILLPKTARGKKQKFSIAKLLKIKGSGVQFSGSFQGGGIHAYDNKRNLFFIKSFSEDGEIKSYADIDNWITTYISKLPSDYFDWLSDQLSKKRLKIIAKEGDIIAYKIAHREYGFARILLDVFAETKKGDIMRPEVFGFHPRSLIVAPYAYYADTLKINVDELVYKKTLPSLCIFDLEVYRGEMPIIGHRPLTTKDWQIPFPKERATSLTIPYTKTDIETFIAVNGMENN
ncbi:MAG TPA: immunity 26/phosphotriesterase HocA family protein [Chitinophagaceae bacterium]